MGNENINIRLIVNGCREKNPNSQRKLYEHFYGYGMSIALRYAKNFPEAEEVFNDAFLRIFKNIDKYDPQYPFKTWLRRVVINTAIDYYRKSKRFRDLFSAEPLPDIETEAAIPLEIGPEDDLLPILQQLPPAYRMVFNLYVMEEYKHHEIAEQLNISVGTSKSNLARAKVKLRELWLKKKEALKISHKHG